MFCTDTMSLEMAYILKTYIYHALQNSDFQEALSKFSSESLSMSLENLSLRRKALQEKTSAYNAEQEQGMGCSLINCHHLEKNCKWMH